jgi:DNA-binding MarR family transcriptional regulator
MKGNIITELGALAVGARMRRLTDTFSKNVMQIYQEHGLDFDPKYFILFYLVAERKSIGIMEAAQELNLTHPAVIHFAKDLEKQGYIQSVKSSTDSRKRLLQLTKKGEKSLPEFKTLWNKIGKLNLKLMNKQTHHLLKAIEEMEMQLEKQSYYNRFNEMK